MDQRIPKKRRKIEGYNSSYNPSEVKTRIYYHPKLNVVKVFAKDEPQLRHIRNKFGDQSINGFVDIFNLIGEEFSEVVKQRFNETAYLFVVKNGHELKFDKEDLLNFYACHIQTTNRYIDNFHMETRQVIRDLEQRLYDCHEQLKSREIRRSREKDERRRRRERNERRISECYDNQERSYPRVERQRERTPPPRERSPSPEKFQKKYEDDLEIEEDEDDIFEMEDKNGEKVFFKKITGFKRKRSK